MSETISLLLDTDIGSDIDDAVALCYLLRQPRCDLLGITTVGGDVARRAACAEVICREMGRKNIPIYGGISQPLLNGPGQPLVPQYEGIRHRPHSLDRRPNAAVDFLRKTIRNAPGEITLLSIGPFTNLAVLFSLDPEIPSLLKSFSSMAGSFFDPMKMHVPAEFNVRSDPIASALIYNKDYAYRQPHLSVGIDVTGRCCLEMDEVRARFVTKPLNVAREMAEVWFRNSKNMAFHDPLAAALLFEPGLCSYASGRITVPLEQTPAGQTQFQAREAGPHRVTKTVDVPQFFDHFFTVCN